MKGGGREVWAGVRLRGREVWVTEKAGINLAWAAEKQWAAGKAEAARSTHLTLHSPEPGRGGGHCP